MAEKSYSGLMSSTVVGSSVLAFFIVSPFTCRCFAATYDTYFTPSLRMNQNENPVFGGHTDVDIALLRFGTVDIWIGKQKRVIEDRFPFIEGHLVFHEVLFCLDFIPFKCQFHSAIRISVSLSFQCLMPPLTGRDRGA